MGFVQNSMFLINFEWNLNGNGWIGGGLGVREHPQCLVVNLEGCSYIQQKALTLTENGFVKNRTFKLCLEQTAQGKMTARTIGSFHVFGKKRDFPCIYQSNLTFWGTPPLFVFLYNKFIS